MLHLHQLGAGEMELPLQGKPFTSYKCSHHVSASVSGFRNVSWYAKLCEMKRGGAEGTLVLTPTPCSLAVGADHPSAGGFWCRQWETRAEESCPKSFVCPLYPGAVIGVSPAMGRGGDAVSLAQRVASCSLLCLVWLCPMSRVLSCPQHNCCKDE